MVVLVVGAEEELLAEALAEAGEDGGVLVLDPSAAALEALERSRPDPRVWYLIGDADVVPLPDRFADAAVGPGGADLPRVLR
jgi:ubiquinone/menaquinone biosynthesis C-methylase UbiE